MKNFGFIQYGIYSERHLNNEEAYVTTGSLVS